MGDHDVAQLIRYVFLGEATDGPTGDLFNLQDEISKTVTDALEAMNGIKSKDNKSAVKSLITLVITMANRHEAQIAALKHVVLKLCGAHETSLNQHKENERKREAVAKVEQARAEYMKEVVDAELRISIDDVPVDVDKDGNTDVKNPTDNILKHLKDKSSDPSIISRVDSLQDPSGKSQKTAMYLPSVSMPLTRLPETLSERTCQVLALNLVAT